MKKRELLRSRQMYQQPVNQEQLKARVSKDLAPIKDTYDIAYQAIQQIQALIASIPSEERPVRAMRELAAALRDAAGVMVAMRGEGRDTVSYSANPSNSTKTGTAEAGGPALPPPTIREQLPIRTATTQLLSEPADPPMPDPVE